MFCRNCGGGLVGTPRLCSNCGAKPMSATNFCPECGIPTTPLTEMCPRCGARVRKPASARTWKPVVAGTLAIIAGAIEILVGLLCVADPWYREDIYVGLALYTVGLVAIMGGILALRRRAWGLALTGAICTLLGSIMVPGSMFRAPDVAFAPPWGWMVILGAPLSILGILAIVLTALSRQEFE